MRAIVGDVSPYQQPLKFAAGRWNLWKLKHHEEQLLAQWDIAMCASMLDVQYFERRQPSKPVYCLVNSFKMPLLAQAPRHAAPTVLFVASMNYWPNNQGILMFLERIWPAVRAAVPDVRLQIVGRGPSQQLRAHDGRHGVSVVGEVAAVGPYYAAADITIAPMTFSVGSAIKILEALAYEKPLVGFEVATRRHGLVSGEHCFSANTAEDFGAKLIQLLHEPGLCRRMAAAGRAFVAERFAKANVEQALTGFLRTQLWNDAVDAPCIPEVQHPLPTAKSNESV